MKKSMKAKRPPAQPAVHPPVLDVKAESSRPSPAAGDRHKPGHRNGPKAAR